MSIEERVKALESKLGASEWSIDGVVDSENFTPGPLELALKCIKALEYDVGSLYQSISGTNAALSEMGIIINQGPTCDEEAALQEAALGFERFPEFNGVRVKGIIYLHKLL